MRKAMTQREVAPTHAAIKKAALELAAHDGWEDCPHLLCGFAGFRL
jgi:hypothetical protein